MKLDFYVVDLPRKVFVSKFLLFEDDSIAKAYLVASIVSREKSLATRPAPLSFRLLLFWGGNKKSQQKIEKRLSDKTMIINSIKSE